MGQFRLCPDRRSKILAPLVVAPVTVIFLWSSGMTGTGLFGTGRVVEASAVVSDPPPKIDGKRAYEYLKKICEIGPRTAGSAANKRQLEMVEAHFTKMGAVVRRQPFVVTHPQTGARLTLTNLIASWHPERSERVVIGAHYDTRPHPDEEPPNRRGLPFLGANDGASGVALEMEIGHHLNQLDTPWGVDLVLFDGEELVFGSGPNKVGNYFLGSEEFARRYAELRDSRRIKYRYVSGIVLDMVGGRNLEIKQEPNSLDSAADLVRQVWSVARSLKANTFKSAEGREVLDDHLALNNVGIPTIDLIDFEYPFWHKADDLPENCSAESLEEVGRVVTTWLTVRGAGVAPPKRKRR
jgi:glutaminyl-peptide cyclotransferase